MDLMRAEEQRSISQYVHWTLERYGYVGTGQVTGDTYVIVVIMGDKGPDFLLSVAADKNDPFGAGGKRLGRSWQHKKLMMKADQREARRAAKVIQVRPTGTASLARDDDEDDGGAGVGLTILFVAIAGGIGYALYAKYTEPPSTRGWVYI